MSLATQIGPDTYVTIAYTLYDEDGEVLDRTEEDEPLSFLYGYGQIVPGLERALEGMVRGSERSLEVAPDEGYGEYDPDAVVEIERSDFPRDDLAVGDQFVAESDDGESVTMTVLEVSDEGCLVDTNHPLAGETLRFTVNVLDVRPATDQEIEEAERALEPVPQLVPLGRKPAPCDQA